MWSGGAVRDRMTMWQRGDASGWTGSGAVRVLSVACPGRGGGGGRPNARWRSAPTCALWSTRCARVVERVLLLRAC